MNGIHNSLKEEKGDCTFFMTSASWASHRRLCSTHLRPAPRVQASTHGKLHTLTVAIAGRGLNEAHALAHKHVPALHVKGLAQAPRSESTGSLDATARPLVRAPCQKQRWFRVQSHVSTCGPPRPEALARGFSALQTSPPGACAARCSSAPPGSTDSPVVQTPLEFAKTPLVEDRQIELQHAGLC